MNFEGNQWPNKRIVAVFAWCLVLGGFPLTAQEDKKKVQELFDGRQPAEKDPKPRLDPDHLEWLKKKMRLQALRKEHISETEKSYRAADKYGEKIVSDKNYAAHLNRAAEIAMEIYKLGGAEAAMRVLEDYTQVAQKTWDAGNFAVAVLNYLAVTIESEKFRDAVIDALAYIAGQGRIEKEDDSSAGLSPLRNAVDKMTEFYKRKDATENHKLKILETFIEAARYSPKESDKLKAVQASKACYKALKQLIPPEHSSLLDELRRIHEDQSK